MGYEENWLCSDRWLIYRRLLSRQAKYYCWKFKKIFKQVILNLGQGAAGTLQEYAILLEYIPENVESIIWFITDNDIIDLEKELKNRYYIIT